MAGKPTDAVASSHGSGAPSLDGGQCISAKGANRTRGYWRLSKVGLVALAVSALLVGCGTSEASQAARYREVNARNASKLQQISTNEASACETESNDMTACKAAYQKMLDAIRTWNSELQSTRVPDCLKPSYESLRGALDLLEQGLTLMLQGIPDDMTNLTLSHMQNLSEGSAKVTEGGDKMSEAMAKGEDANCGT